MDKPLALKKADFCKGLVNLINECGLPAFVVADVMRELSEKTAAFAQNELEAETAAYYKAIKEAESNEDKGAEG